MNGTFQVTSEQSIVISGDIERGLLSNNSHGVVSITLISPNATIGTACSTSDTNIIQVNRVLFKGAVDCGSGGDTTAQPSSSFHMTGARQDSGDSSGSKSSRDSDGDGIPDSSDSCAHNSNPRCYKEAT